MRAVTFLALLTGASLLVIAIAANERSQTVKSSSDGARLYRVILPAKDIAATTKWYEDLFQLTGEFVGPNRVYLDCGPVILALVEPPAGTEARPNQEYVYFAVSDLKAYHERATRLKALDDKMGKIQRQPWGEVSFYAQDPLGNPLCFVDEKTLFTGKKSEKRQQ